MSLVEAARIPESGVNFQTRENALTAFRELNETLSTAVDN